MKNTFDLTGLQLTDLKIIQGASETLVRFDVQNPVPMDTFIFTTASSAELSGLATLISDDDQRLLAVPATTPLTSADITTVDIKAGVSIKIIILIWNECSSTI